MKISHPIITIIVLNYNGKQYLKRCFESIRKQSIFEECEIIMIDNASTDDSVQYVTNNYPWVKIAQNNKNLGYAEANNNAAKSSNGEYLLFLNNDTWMEPNTIKMLVYSIQNNKKIGACAPKIMDYEKNRDVSLGVGCDIFGYPSSTVTDKVFYVDGAALFIRKNVFEEVDGFDKRYFLFYEDVDLSWKLQLYGYKIVTVPKAIIYHVSGGTYVGGAIKNRNYITSVRRRYLGEKNNICNLLKNYSFLTLLIIIPFYLLINICEISIFLITGNQKVINAYLEAWIWNIKNLKTTLILRNKIQNNRTISDREIIKAMYFGCIKFRVFKSIGIPKFR